MSNHESKRKAKLQIEEKKSSAYYTDQSIFARRLTDAINAQFKSENGIMNKIKHLEKKIQEGYGNGIYEVSIDDNTIYKYTTGQRWPRDYKIIRVLCQALNTSADYLLGLQNSSENLFDQFHKEIANHKNFLDRLFASQQYASDDSEEFNLLQDIYDYIFSENIEWALVYGEKIDDINEIAKYLRIPIKQRRSNDSDDVQVVEIHSNEMTEFVKYKTFEHIKLDLDKLKKYYEDNNYFVNEDRASLIEELSKYDTPFAVGFVEELKKEQKVINQKGENTDDKK